MPDIREQGLSFLARLGARPAVAFHEEGVASTIAGILRELGLDYKVDSYGNIIAQLSGRDVGQPAIAFVSHMDHPGFEATGTQGDYLLAQARGGVPAASFSPGVPLWVVLGDGERLRATTAGPWGQEADRQISARLEQNRSVDLPCPMVFDLVDFVLDGRLIRMRALDDLAGCAAILTTLAALSDQQAHGAVYGVFTRAEEIGLIGARLLAEARALPQETMVVSAEASRALPGAAHGEGPVIRVGDASFTFSSQAESVLIRAREILQSRPEGFKSQRQLMSGGTCEATAFTYYGYHSTGIAFPLGNYHNGAPNNGIEAEFIHVDDFLGGVELMVQAVLSVPGRGDTGPQRRLLQLPEDARRRLQASALTWRLPQSNPPTLIE